VPVGLREKGCEARFILGASLPIYISVAGSPALGVFAFWLCPERSPLCLLAGGEPVAFAVHLQDVEMMGEAVGKRAGEPFRAEDRSPFIERQVACDQRGTAFIALAEHLEEQFGADSRERHIAQLIDDQQLDCVEVLLQRAQATFVARFHEFMHEGGGGARSIGDVPLFRFRNSRSVHAFYRRALNRVSNIAKQGTSG
jgi:hypothetical protein